MWMYLLSSEKVNCYTCFVTISIVQLKSVQKMLFLILFIEILSTLANNQFSAIQLVTTTHSNCQQCERIRARNPELNNVEFLLEKSGKTQWSAWKYESTFVFFPVDNNNCAQLTITCDDAAARVVLLFDAGQRPLHLADQSTIIGCLNDRRWYVNGGIFTPVTQFYCSTNNDTIRNGMFLVTFDSFLTIIIRKLMTWKLLI
jgi:hypothetical protein